MDSLEPLVVPRQNLGQRAAAIVAGTIAVEGG